MPSGHPKDWKIRNLKNITVVNMQVETGALSTNISWIVSTSPIIIVLLTIFWVEIRKTSGTSLPLILHKYSFSASKWFPRPQKASLRSSAARTNIPFETVEKSLSGQWFLIPAAPNYRKSVMLTSSVSISSHNYPIFQVQGRLFRPLSPRLPNRRWFKVIIARLSP
jgi:hypothetical protein